MATERWPALPLAQWRDTKDTLHMWMQVVGKLALARTPLVNHWWNVALHYTARGVATLPMDVGDGDTLIAEFDFVSHELLLRTSDGSRERVKLEPKTVARFYAEVMDALHRMGITMEIWTMPVEVENAIAFERDTVHGSYDPQWAGAFWRALQAMRPVFEEFRCGFVGKCSPLHFFWGSFDLALTRFSGNRAPDAPQADPVTREAYSHEVISHGFWPGGAGFDDAAFYGYAAPEPEGFTSAKVQPPSARYDAGMNVFVLPYEAVRTAASPEGELASFLETTYRQAAALARWDRARLER